MSGFPLVRLLIAEHDMGLKMETDHFSVSALSGMSEQALYCLVSS